MELWSRKSEEPVEADAGKVTRAYRYEMNAAASYRFPHQAGWTEGRVANMSSSGLLLETAELLQTGAEFEVQVPLISESLGIESQMLCRCTVVRSEHENGRFAAGARITAYALGSPALSFNECGT